MIKPLLSLSVLGCFFSCFIGVAQADFGIKNDVVFLNLNSDPFPDIACAPTPALQAIPRAVQFTLQNNKYANFRLFNARMVRFAHDDSGMRFSFDDTPIAVGNPNCITYTDPVTNYGQGSIAALSQCTLTVEFIPPLCNKNGANSTSVPMSAAIHQLLAIGVGSQQDYLLLEAHAEVNVIGSGNQFAVLGLSQPPVNQGNGNSMLFGNLGVMASLPATGFTLPNSATAYSDATNPVVIGSEADFESAYATLIGGLNANVTPPTPGNNCFKLGSLHHHKVLTSGAYCLSEAYIPKPPAIITPTPTDVSLSGTVTLSGAGNFYFFIDPAKHCLVDRTPTYRMCNLIVKPTFNIIYAGDRHGNTPGPENVFWILSANPAGTFAPAPGPLNPPWLMGSYDLSHVYLANGARLDGSILGGAGSTTPSAFGSNVIVEYGTGDRAVNIYGSVWSRYGVIKLAGTTVKPAR